MAKKIIIIISVFAIVGGSLAFAFAPVGASAETSYPTYIDKWNASGYVMSLSRFKSNTSGNNITNLSNWTVLNFSDSIYSCRTLLHATELQQSPFGFSFYNYITFRFGSAALNSTSNAVIIDNVANAMEFGEEYVGYFITYQIAANPRDLVQTAVFVTLEDYFNIADVVSCTVTSSSTLLRTVVSKTTWSSGGTGVLPSSTVDAIQYTFTDNNGRRLAFVFPWKPYVDSTYANTAVYFKNLDANQLFQNGFNQGYQQGYTSGNTDGYTSGYDVGKSDGINQGYSSGYDDGLLASNNYSFLQLFTSVVQAPVDIFKSMFDFEILGFNLSHFLTALLSVGLIIAIVARIKS